MPQEQFFCTSCKGRKRLDAHGKPSLMKGPTTKSCPLCDGIGYLRNKEKIEQDKSQELSKEIKEVLSGGFIIDDPNEIDNKHEEIEKDALPPKRRGRPPKKR